MWGKGQPSIRQQEKPQREPTLPAPWSWTSSLQCCAKIKFCFSSHTVCGTFYGSPNKLIQMVRGGQFCAHLCFPRQYCWGAGCPWTSGLGQRSGIPVGVCWLAGGEPSPLPFQAALTDLWLLAIGFVDPCQIILKCNIINCRECSEGVVLLKALGLFFHNIWFHGNQNKRLGQVPTDGWEIPLGDWNSH